MIITRDIASVLSSLPVLHAADKVFVLADSNTAIECVPLIVQKHTEMIVISAGEEHKNLASLQTIWDALTEYQATRHSLLICVGGGMITDLGGMAAATFKRGMQFVNVPTSLLGAVDASVGGKTGINYHGLKNLVGVFAQPAETVIYPEFFRTLDGIQRLSGFAEMVKHALLTGNDLLDRTLAFDIEHFDLDDLTPLIEKNIETKSRIVEADPTEKGLRKTLNFGHTLGHAFESLSHQQQHPIPHGYAVMWGMVGELYLSMLKMNFDRHDVSRLSALAREYYTPLNINCKQYDTLFALMQQDKKNHHDRIIFTLLAAAGKAETDCNVTRNEIYEALDFIATNAG
ncbi:MAG: 3-dehydroquinate synthase [Candidatus Aphodosoma sp.]